MKKTTYLWLCLMVFAFVACGGGAKSKLIGNWEAETRNGKATKDAILLELKKDETFSQSFNKKARKGKWDLSKDGKTLNLYPDGSRSESMTIVKIEGDKMLLKEDKEEFKMKKRK